MLFSILYAYPPLVETIFRIIYENVSTDRIPHVPE